jgi:predicted anti-sigma-YlaC factor YlaD
MNDCERLSDRMPDVALGRAAWTAGEAAHLGACTECRAEWELVQGARRLDTRAPRVNAEAVAVAVQQRLARDRQARRHTRWIRTAGSAAAAAAVAAAIVLAVTGRDDPAGETGPHVVAEGQVLVPLPELDGLETAQLDTLLQALDGSLAGSPSREPGVAGDDADAELDEILATWEG